MTRLHSLLLPSPLDAGVDMSHENGTRRQNANATQLVKIVQVATQELRPRAEKRLKTRPEEYGTLEKPGDSALFRTVLTKFVVLRFVDALGTTHS